MTPALDAATAGFAATHTLALVLSFGIWTFAVWLYGVWTGRGLKRRADWTDGHYQGWCDRGRTDHATMKPWAMSTEER